jgi:uncharacterized protein YjdB
MSNISSKLSLAIVLTLAMFFGACAGGTGKIGNTGGGGGSSNGDTTVEQVTITLPTGVSASTPITVGGTIQLTAWDKLEDGSMVNSTATVTWTSSNTAVATVNTTGLVTITGVGTVTITALASPSGQTGSVTLTGVAKTSGGGGGGAATLQSMAVTPSSPAVALGRSQQFAATGTYSDGSSKDVTSSATWTSSATSIASVTSGGLAQSLTVGASTITATVGSVTANTTFTVGPKVVVAVAISPSNPTIGAGQSVQFTSTATYSDGTTGDVTSSTTWSSSPTSVMTVNAGGLALALSKGSFTLTATAGGQTAMITGTIGNPVATGIQISPASASIPSGSTQTFHATATMSDGTTQDVSSSTSWQSSNNSVATVDNSGVATAVGAGVALITGTYQTFSTGASITVTSATAQSITVTPAIASIAKGTTQQFTATATLTDGSTQNVSASATWASTSTSVATVAPGGLATGVAQGNTTISAAYGGKTGNAALAVTNATLVAIVITPPAPAVASGGTLQLKATGTFSDLTTQDLTSTLTYVSTNNSVATVDSSGVVHGGTPGTATITASQGSVSTQFTVTITNATLQSIAITPASPTFAAGSTQQFTATGTYSDGSTQDVTSTVLWLSSNPLVASVDLSGMATGISAGTTTITGTILLVSGSTDVTVSSATITAVTVTPSTATVAAGQSQAFTASASLSDGTSQDVTASAHWGVSNPLVALVSNLILNPGTATGLTAGTTQVTASIGGVTGSATLTVGAATVTGVTVNPPTVSIAQGVPTNLTATATYSDGSSADVTLSATWQSSSPSVAGVILGLVTPLTVGSSTVSATLQGQTGSSAVTVTAATLSSIAITPTTLSLPLGLSGQLAAIGTYSDGTVQNITNTVHWASSLGSIATVSGAGLVVSLMPGTTTVSATLGSVTANVDITISPATLQSIAVTAPQNSVALGFALQLTATGTYSDGSTQNVTALVQWSSSSGAVASVNVAGLVSGLLAGSFTATATLQGVSGQLGVTISPAVLQSLSISPTGLLSALLGHQLALTGTFSDGSTQVITSGVHWSVSATLLASISNTGFLLPLGLGNITVTATFGGLSAQVNITLI